MTAAQPSPGAAHPGPAAAGQPAVPDQTDAPAPVVRGDPVPVPEGGFVIPDHCVPLVPDAGLVVGDRAVLVIETGLGPRNGAHVVDQARRLASRRPLYLTTAHFHPEHGFRGAAFLGAATIVYHAAPGAKLRRRGAGYIEMFPGVSPAYAAELGGVELTGPDITYDGRAEIDLGGHTAVVQSRGPAHTASGRSIQVDDRVLFTGDLRETRSFPIVPYFPRSTPTSTSRAGSPCSASSSPWTPRSASPATAKSPIPRRSATPVTTSATSAARPRGCGQTARPARRGGHDRKRTPAPLANIPIGSARPSRALYQTSVPEGPTT